MPPTKTIEKIRPIVLLVFLLIIISSILPLIFLAPLDHNQTTFNRPEIGGDMYFSLDGQNVNYSIKINYYDFSQINEHITDIGVAIQANNDLKILSFKEYSLNSTQSFPIVFNGSFKLVEPIIYSLEYNFKTSIFFGASSGNAYIPSGFIYCPIGRFDLPLYEKWFFLTFSSTSILLMISLAILKRKMTFSYKTVLMNFLNQSYEAYEEIISNLNETLNLILIISPLMLVLSVLLQIYIHFGLIFSVINDIYNSKQNMIIYLFLYTSTIVFSPAIITEMFDRYHEFRKVKKTRFNSNLIYSNFFIFFYLFLFALILILPSSFIYYVCFFLSFIFQVLVFYHLLSYHCYKWDYKVSKTDIIISAITAKLVLIGIFYFALQFFIFSSNYSYPVYLLIL